MDLFASLAPAAPAEKVFTVTQLTRRVKDALEGGIGTVWVQGEISNHRRQTSGHHYFTLKDAGAQLACVLFKGSAQFVKAPIADGLMIQAFGDITVYEARGQYQMLVRNVQAAGQGSLQLRFEELKRRLAAEGLFSVDAKQDIPRLPQTVAIVTSPTGAALQDMLNILRRRAPYLHILIAAVRVQGAGAEHEIADAIRMIDAESGESLPVIDTVVVARGGGSLEDLWCFNEEVVARAIHECSIPVISAVGHEIDFTIADFTADLRAPTPSAAAELLAPDREELLADAVQCWQRIARAMQQTLVQERRALDLTARTLRQTDAERLLLPWRQQLDQCEQSLSTLVSTELTARRSAAENLRLRLESHRPDQALASFSVRLQVLRERLQSRITQSMERSAALLKQSSSLLRTLGPQSAFERGFTCTTDKSGRVVRDASELKLGDEFETRFRRGKVKGIVKEVSSSGRPAK